MRMMCATTKKTPHQSCPHLQHQASHVPSLSDILIPTWAALATIPPASSWPSANRPPSRLYIASTSNKLPLRPPLLPPRTFLHHPPPHRHSHPQPGAVQGRVPLHSSAGRQGVAEEPHNGVAYPPPLADAALSV